MILRSRHRLVALALAALVSGAGPARAADGVPAPDPGRWCSIGVLSGSSMPDAALANYQWHVLPRTAWGAEALAGRGALAAGLRFWRTQTTQTSELPSGTFTSAVHLTSLEAVGRVRLARALGVDVMGATSLGRVRVAWDPDQISIDTGSGPIEATFAPVNEWIAGAGVAFSRPLVAGWSAGLDLDRRFFRMDTAHRNGNAIEYRRDTFGDWSARFELARHYGPR